MPGRDWYRYGTITVNKNSDHVIGTNTQFADIKVKPGDIFTIDSMKKYEIKEVTDNNNLLLKTPYLEDSVTNSAYCIIRLATDSTADIAADVAELNAKFTRHIDEDLEVIKGESAYELAVQNGFVGTEAQWLDTLTAYGVAKKGGYTGTQAEWLESLKAAGEWTQASSRLTALEAKHAFRVYEEITQDAQRLHKMYHRYKNLGNTITAAQYNAIGNWGFADLYVGDYWELGVGRAVIVDVGNPANKGCCHIALITEINTPMNDTATTEGGYKGSKIYNEVIPQLTADLEAEIGAEHVWAYSESVYDSPDFNELDIEHSASDTSKLNLFKLHEIFRDIHAEDLISPYALFQYPQGEWGHLFLFFPHCYWLQDVYRGDPTKQFMLLSYGFSTLYHTNANDTSYGGTPQIRVIAHFKLIKE